jgi:anti-sigma B factor antagonist
MEQPKKGPLMKIEITELKKGSLIAISGRIDSDTSPEVAKAFQSVQDGGQYNLFVDMAGLEYISSATLRALMSAQRTSKRNAGEVVLLRVPETILNVLDMAGLVELYRVVQDPSTLPELEGVQLPTYPAPGAAKKDQQAAA